MNFSHLLNPGLIICDLKGTTREDIYLEMLRQLKKTVTKTDNIEKICDDIISHEELIGMANEFGVAIPHTRTADVDDLHIIIGIHKNGVILKSIDTTPTHVVVMCLISKATSNTYLLTLRAISKYFMTAGNLNKVIKCGTPRDVTQLFIDDKLDVKHTIT
ncbi:MAG: PTS sugar transporter subunit IIA, partial [Lentisphaeria bacterium]